MTKKELDIFRAKITVKDWLIDICIDVAEIPNGFSNDIVVPFFITPRVYNRVKERYPLAKVYYVETKQYKNIFGKAIPEEDAIYLDNEKELSQMKFKNPKFISNPPYGNLGGPIIAAVKSSNPKAKQSILMPISCYKAKVKWTDGKEYPLYQFADKVKVIGGDGFDAVITENNCVITLSDEPDVTKTYQDLVLMTVDQRYKEAYLWNISNNRGLDMHQENYKDISAFDINLDFVETARCFSLKSGAGFGKGGFGYEFNVLKNVHKEIPKMLGVTKLTTKRGKENFATAWYAAGKKNAGLLSKLIIGVNVVAASGEYYYAIPQIDWDMISTNQKDLWDAGKYDEAILTEMGLKWEGDKIVKA